MCGIFEETESTLKTFLRERKDFFFNELHDFKSSAIMLSTDDNSTDESETRVRLLNF